MDVGLAQVQGWSVELEALCERIAPRFGRVEVRRRAGAFLRGLLAGVERKNGWRWPSTPGSIPRRDAAAAQPCSLGSRRGP